ncbi:hypothetical protein CPB83DRAFT_885296 [Crepidotus variabilis]|uniref:Uncharacterized protein n=1 Tax=Crepidotus variabilis TaxID=179855 RepID=A0A9P6JM34_9AGAR|nr:hypothetical protein CPB83DRAFT_885296 [Crepidotus variabilis]
MATILRPELLDQIFGFLEFDLVSLKNCALASLSLYHEAERHLYKHIELLPTTRRGKGIAFCVTQSQLLQLLVAKPHMTNCIQSIYMEITPEDLFIPIQSDDDYADVKTSPTPPLPSLCSLTICSFKPEHCPDWSEVKRDWTCVEKSFRIFWEGLMYLPSIEEVTIRDVYGFPLAILDYCQNLKRLNLFNLLLSTTSLPLRAPPSQEHLSPLLQVRYLSLSDNEDGLSVLLEWLTESTALTATKCSLLRTLEFQPQSLGCFNSILEFMNTCRLGLMSSFRTSYTPFDSPSGEWSNFYPSPPLEMEFPSLPNLHKLSIFADILYDTTQGPNGVHRRYVSSLPAIGEILRRFHNTAVANALKTIDIHLTVLTDAWDSPVLADIDFAPLASVLSQNSASLTVVLVLHPLENKPGTPYHTILMATLISEVASHKDLRGLLTAGHVLIKSSEHYQ